MVSWSSVKFKIATYLLQKTILKYWLTAVYKPITNWNPVPSYNSLKVVDGDSFANIITDGGKEKFKGVGKEHDKSNDTYFEEYSKNVCYSKECPNNVKFDYIIKGNGVIMLNETKYYFSYFTYYQISFQSSHASGVLFEVNKNGIIPKILAPADGKTTIHSGRLW